MLVPYKDAPELASTEHPGEFIAPVLLRRGTTLNWNKTKYPGEWCKDSSTGIAVEESRRGRNPM